MLLRKPAFLLHKYRKSVKFYVNIHKYLNFIMKDKHVSSLYQDFSYRKIEGFPIHFNIYGIELVFHII